MATEREEALQEELDAVRRVLRDFEHVEGESVVEMAAVAVSAYGLCQHSREHWERLAKHWKANHDNQVELKRRLHEKHERLVRRSARVRLKRAAKRIRRVLRWTS